MQHLLKTYGTTFTVGLFIVSTVSGVFLFFHIASSAFHGMHEWLSMVLIVPVAFHIWKNWTGLLGYFKRKTIYMPLVVSIIAGFVFAYPSLSSSSSGGNPLRATVQAVQGGTITQIAPLYKLSPEALKARLQAKGYTVTSFDQPIVDIAKASGKGEGPDLMAAIAFPE